MFSVIALQRSVDRTLQLWRARFQRNDEGFALSSAVKTFPVCKLSGQLNALWFVGKAPFAGQLPSGCGRSPGNITPHQGSDRSPESTSNESDAVVGAAVMAHPTHLQRSLSKTGIFA